MYPPRLLIADDHTIFGETLRVYLERSYTVLAIVSNGRAMIEEAIRLRPDLIVVDVGMPILNGLDAARKLRKEAPSTKFVFLTMHDDRNMAAAAMELGAVGFVLKHSGGKELLQAIAHVLRGQPYLTPRLRAEDWALSKARAQHFDKELTTRQRDFLQLYAEGRPMKEIADILDVSEKTAEFHKHRIMESFGVENNAALVLLALKSGLISINS